MPPIPSPSAEGGSELRPPATHLACQLASGATQANAVGTVANTGAQLADNGSIESSTDDTSSDSDVSWLTRTVPSPALAYSGQSSESDSDPVTPSNKRRRAVEDMTPPPSSRAKKEAST
jgi:hypothetical protein